MQVVAYKDFYMVANDEGDGVLSVTRDMVGSREWLMDYMVSDAFEENDELERSLLLRFNYLQALNKIPDLSRGLLHVTRLEGTPIGKDTKQLIITCPYFMTHRLNLRVCGTSIPVWKVVVCKADTEDPMVQYTIDLYKGTMLWDEDEVTYKWDNESCNMMNMLNFFINNYGVVAIA